MIDPVIFTIRIGNLALPVYWYGVILMTAIVIGTLVAEREIRRRGENADFLWDAMLFVLPAGIIGARVWYVVTDILGGNSRYLEEPLQMLNTRAGGLHIFGAFLLGGVVAVWFIRRQGIDVALLLDGIAPALLIGQAVARPANFINQELYGPPTDLPWGIMIAPEKRIPPFNDLTVYPAETQFHPTFAYEMIWNLLAAGVLLYITRRFPEKVKPGAAFAAWLVLAGVGRVLIESFRPDQPRVPGTDLSYSRLVSGLMALGGLLWLLARYGVVHIPWLGRGSEQYHIRENKDPQSQTQEA